VGSDLAPVAAIDDVELAGPGDLVAEADAACAEDAALRVQDDPLSDPHYFALVHLGSVEPALVLPVGHVIVLEIAFSGLIADRAVEWMVEEEELQDASLHLLDARGVRPAREPLLRESVARDLQLSHAVPFDQRTP